MQMEYFVSGLLALIVMAILMGSAVSQSTIKSGSGLLYQFNQNVNNNLYTVLQMKVFRDSKG